MQQLLHFFETTCRPPLTGSRTRTRTIVDHVPWPSCYHGHGEMRVANNNANQQRTKPSCELADAEFLAGLLYWSFLITHLCPTGVTLYEFGVVGGMDLVGVLEMLMVSVLGAEVVMLFVRLFFRSGSEVIFIGNTNEYMNIGEYYKSQGIVDPRYLDDIIERTLLDETYSNGDKNA